MKLKSNLEYSINNTIFGSQLIVGIREKNSFVKFGKEALDIVPNLIDKFKNDDIEDAMPSLSEYEKAVIKGFDKMGYLNNGLEPKSSFNEFKKIGRKFVEISPKNIEKIHCKSYYIFFIVFIIVTSILAVAVFLNKSNIPTTIDYINMSIPEIIISITCFPFLILGLHELGHYIFAQFMGIKVSKITLGWFVIYPIVLVQYEGMHFHSLKRKLTVILGGVYGNFLCGTITLIIKSLYFNEPNVLLDLWISSHFACILTNLNLWGMTDGYFLVTTITGLMNLRLKGYKYLNNILCRKNQKFNKQYALCAFILLFLFITGFVNVALQILYIGSLFSLNKVVIIGIICIYIIFLLSKFIVRIVKAF